MNDEEADLETVEVKVYKEHPEVFGGEEAFAEIWWGEDVELEACSAANHPYWVIDYLEAGGWKKHFEDPDYRSEVTGYTVVYNPEERNDIRKLILPDGTEITAEER